jgi:hypothetical protein
MKVMLHQPKTIAEDVNLEFTVYLDEDWDKVDATTEPCKKNSLARQNRGLALNANGTWGKELVGSLSQNVRPHIWYFAVSDCANKLHNFTHRLKFEFKALQYDGSEFSIEMRYMLTCNILFLLFLIILMWQVVQKMRKFSKSAGAIHPVIWTLVSAMIFQLIGQTFHTLHLFLYRSNGSGVKALEVLSEILFMISQVIQSSLLILIGLGYTLLQSKIGELDLIIPLAFMIGVIHIMLVGFGKIKDDAAYKYHENEGVIGYVLMFMRLLLYVWFLWAVQSSAKEGGMQVQRFYAQFRNAGTVYFMTYPAIFLITKCFAPYLQHSVNTLGLMVMQMGSNVWLASLFLNRGDYFKASTLSDSDLPGGCKIGMVKEE